MKLVDTGVIIGSLNPTDRLHSRCIKHLNRIGLEPDVLVPMVSVLEADLVMKGRGYSHEEQRSSWQALEYKIPTAKLITNSISSIQTALSLQERGLDYFDSLISSLALEHNATVITTDRTIKGVVETEW